MSSRSETLLRSLVSSFRSPFGFRFPNYCFVFENCTGSHSAYAFTSYDECVVHTKFLYYVVFNVHRSPGSVFPSELFYINTLFQPCQYLFSSLRSFFFPFAGLFRRSFALPPRLEFSAANFYILSPLRFSVNSFLTNKKSLSRVMPFLTDTNLLIVSMHRLLPDSPSLSDAAVPASFHSDLCANIPSVLRCCSPDV